MTSVPPPSLHGNTKATRQGREFCAFGLQNKISCVPVDEAEDHLFDGFIERLHIDEVLPIVSREILDEIEDLESPKVLDCGYGTGIWINELLNILDNVDNDGIIGIDIFDRQSTGVQQFHKRPMDLNAMLPTSWKNRFDLINSRFLTDGINKDRWEALIAEYKLILKPGGWLQLVEVRWMFRSQSDHALPSLDAWTGAYEESLEGMQKNPAVAMHLERYLRWEGFEYVEAKIHNVPVGSWRPEDDDDDEDVSVIRYVHDMLESFALVAFMQTPGRTMQDCMEKVEAAQAELRTLGADIFFEITVVCGKKSMKPTG